MKRIRLGGEDFIGFEGDQGLAYYEEETQEPCILCLRLDEKGLCDEQFKCPHVDEMRKGVMPDCVVY